MLNDNVHAGDCTFSLEGTVLFYNFNSRPTVGAKVRLHLIKVQHPPLLFEYGMGHCSFIQKVLRWDVTWTVDVSFISLQVLANDRLTPIDSQQSSLRLSLMQHMIPVQSIV